MARSPRPTPRRARLGHLLRPHAVVLTVSVVLTLAATVLAIVQPIALARVVDSMDAGSALTSAMTLLAAVTLGEAAVRSVQSYAVHRTSESLVLGLRASLTDHVLRLPVTRFDQHRRGDLVSLLGSDTNQVRQVLTSGALDVVSAGVLTAGSLLMMFVVDPALMGITVAVLGLTLLLVVPVSAHMRRTTYRYQGALGHLSTQFDAALSAIRLLRAYDDTGRHQRRLADQATVIHGHGLRLARLNALVEPVVSVATQGALLVVLAVGGMRVAAGTLSIGNLVAFLLYLVMVVLPIGQLVGALTRVQGGIASLDRIDEVLRDETEDVGGGLSPAPSAPSAPSTPSTPSTPSGSVGILPQPAFVLTGVTYEHAPGAGIRGVDLAIPAGKVTAVVGPSGAGKSTLLALLQRFVDPAVGTVSFRGTPLPDLDLSAYRRRLHVVEQNAPTLASTLRENLTVGCSDAGRADLVEALRTVRLHHLLDRQDALDTAVGDGGLTLSGGERQRLAWARLLLSPRDVLLLDEPTSNVDALSERAFVDVLERSARGRTVVVVAHRMSTIRGADQIVVVDAGRVVDVGTHEELVGRCPVYARMTAEQLAA